MSIANKTFTVDEQHRLAELVKQGVKIKQEVKDLNDSLKDTIKSVAETLDIDAKLLRKAVNSAFKQDIAEKALEVNEVEELLEMLNMKE